MSKLFDSLNKSLVAGTPETGAPPIHENKPDHHMSMSQMREGRDRKNVDDLVGDQDGDEDTEFPFDYGKISGADDGSSYTFSDRDFDLDKDGNPIFDKDELEKMNNDLDYDQEDCGDVGTGGSKEKTTRPEDRDDDEEDSELQEYYNELLALERELFPVSESAPKSAKTMKPLYEMSARERIDHCQTLSSRDREICLRAIEQRKANCSCQH